MLANIVLILSSEILLLVNFIANLHSNKYLLLMSYVNSYDIFQLYQSFYLQK